VVGDREDARGHNSNISVFSLAPNKVTSAVSNEDGILGSQSDKTSNGCCRDIPS
jgi:hypothetical protein